MFHKLVTYSTTNITLNHEKDSYISTEALLLGLCARDTLFTMKALESQGVTIDNMKEAVQTFRQKSGSGQAGQASRVTSRSAEGLYDALEKYGIDFTKNAEDGKREFKTNVHNSRWL